ncbi:MAG: hypothetical protein IJX66_00695 [Lachnospiraceae bacterium]|nr:hypothetical protein [Lachnospiraceae bacterium]
MKTFKKILFKLLFPHIAIVIILIPIATALLTYTFAFGSTNELIAYVSYFLSAYALTVVCTRAPKIFRTLRRIKTENKYINLYVTDVHLRVKISLYCSLSINVLYALLQLLSGIHYHSGWFYALSGYYALLILMRFFLLRDTLKSDLGKNRLSEWKRYRFCGFILLVAHSALTVIVAYIVWLNRGFTHNEILTIAMAAYTFFSMTTAIINVIKYRRYESPVMSAAKAISLAAALISMLSLETAMLTAFGEGNDPTFRLIMTGTTGSAVCLLVLTLAIYMIIHATKEIKKVKKGVRNND